MSDRQYPAVGGYPPPFTGQQQPSPVTAVTGGVLAIISGLYYGWGLLDMLQRLIKHFGVARLITAVAAALVVGLLVAGGIMVLLRHPTGRLLSIVGASGGIALAVVLAVLHVVDLDHKIGLSGDNRGALAYCVPALAAMVLVIVKPTARWLAAAPPPKMPPGDGPPMGYPPLQYPRQQYPQPTPPGYPPRRQ